ncbi:MAG TPA: hypothetical protein DEQ38_03140 [Elusimicrobia bacterium]|nr:MAG: hypothetical protein A2089_06510 [Elusimicrobia bacterium GWD2_63_28]HCC47100.1 hypothetical protein [Elusimicrobiota bacterium]
MKRKLINSALFLALACPSYAAGPARPISTRPGQPKTAVKAAPAVSPWEEVPQHNIKTGDIVVYTPVTGITTAQETYDIFAPFDGRIEDLQTEMFSFATVKTVLARMVSTEMAALLDSSTEESRKQTERRWQDVYSYTEIRPEVQGVITNIYIEPRTRVNKGDRLFTVAKKVVIIGRNTEPVYSKLAAGMTAKVKHARTDSEFDTTLINFLRVKGTASTNRLWLEVKDLKDGIKIGEQFDGQLFVGKSENAMLVPRGHLVQSGGKRFLITEVQTGLETAAETEILGHTSIYLQPPFTGTAKTGDAKDGKDQKSR